MKGSEMSKTSTERIYEIIRSPLISEKSTFISQFNYYVFKVSPNSSKNEIKNAVENIFKVEVKSVNTLIQKGKRKNLEVKLELELVLKAFVKLAEGQTIDTTVEVK